MTTETTPLVPTGIKPTDDELENLIVWLDEEVGKTDVDDIYVNPALTKEEIEIIIEALEAYKEDPTN